MWNICTAKFVRFFPRSCIIIFSLWEDYSLLTSVFILPSCLWSKDTLASRCGRVRVSFVRTRESCIYSHICHSLKVSQSGDTLTCCTQKLSVRATARRPTSHRHVNTVVHKGVLFFSAFREGFGFVWVLHKSRHDR
jgi:hypothetical protein